MKRGTLGRLLTWVAPLATVLLAPAQAWGVDQLSGGVGLGGFQAGTRPRLAVGPHAGVSWGIRRDFIFTIHELCNFLPPINGAGFGVFNETSLTIGYASEKAIFSGGPSLSIYYIPACGLTLCGRVLGVGPGGHAQAEIFFAGPLGVSVSANVNWIGGKSLVLPGGMAVMVVAGPVLRWRAK